MSKVIVTHQRPDLDALASAWLVARSVGADSTDLVFVPDGTAIDAAFAVVDTGKVLDTETMRFDHHQTGAPHASATALVFAYLHTTDSTYLQPLIDLINAADLGERTDLVRFSRDNGLHALFGAVQYSQNRVPTPDAEMARWAFARFDIIAAALAAGQGPSAIHAMTDAETALVAARLADRQRIAVGAKSKFLPHPASARIGTLWHGDARHTQAVWDLYPTLDVCFTYSEQPDTVACLVTRRPDFTIHCGAMRRDAVAILAARETCADADDVSEAVAEMETWFDHTSGFFSGRGTPTSPNPRRVEPAVLIIIADALLAALEKEPTP